MVDSANVSVYVVAGREEKRVNDRVLKLLSLRDQFFSVTLVTPGESVSTSDRLRAPPFIGLTGILRVLGLHSLKQAIDRYLYFPSLDIRFIWAVKRPLLKRLQSDLDAGRKAVVVLTFPPHALGHLAVSIKKALPGVRVVLDWQDLWSFDPNYYDRTPKLFKKRVHRWERSFIESADLHLATNSRAADILVGTYNAPAEKVSYIEHHFHPDDLLSDQERAFASHGSQIRLAFMGTIDKPPRVPGRELLKVLEQVNTPDVSVELHVYGGVPSLSSGEMQRMENHGIVFHGLVTHEEATRAMLNYDVLVLLLADMPNSRVVLSIKLPHYLLADKPILAVVPKDSAIADVINATGAGRVIDSSGEADVAWQEVVAELLTDGDWFSALDSKRSQQAVGAYHWDKIAPRWVAAITGENISGKER